MTIYETWTEVVVTYFVILALVGMGVEDSEESHDIRSEG